MTISFRAGDDEELYKEFCDEAGIDYSALPRSMIEEVANSEDAQDIVRKWTDSEQSFITYLRTEEAIEPEYEEAFDRIEAGLEYGLDDQVVQGLEELQERGYRHAERIEQIIFSLDEQYRQMLEQ